VQRAASRKTDIFKHPSMRKTCMGKCLVKFKDSSSVSRQEVSNLRRIPVMLREQHCWEIVCSRRNVGTLFSRKL
jgi:hypothetical protein